MSWKGNTKIRTITIGKIILNLCDITIKPNFFSSSDFEEDPEGRHEEQPSLFEVRNAELCEQIEDDDFQLVLLDEPDEAAEQTEDDKSTNTHPDSLNKTFT